MKFACGMPIMFLAAMLSCVTPPQVVLKTAEVNARQGLVLRESPDLNAKKIMVIPWAEKVEVIEYGEAEITRDGITSKWARVVYDDAEGWVFGGYLIPVEPHERIRLGRKNNPNGYIGAVYTELGPSIKNMGGSMIGGRFSVSIIVSGSSEILLFNESVSRSGTFIKWKVADVFVVPAAQKDDRFIYPGLCRIDGAPQPGGEAFAVVKDTHDENCNFSAVQRAWMFDFTEKKVKEIQPKNIVCRQECCGRGCL